MFEYVYSYYPENYTFVLGLAGNPILHSETFSVMAANNEEADLLAEEKIKEIRAREEYND